MLIVGTPFNTKDALTSNMPKHVTYDCSVARKGAILFYWFAKRSEESYPCTRVLFLFFFSPGHMRQRIFSARLFRDCLMRGKIKKNLWNQGRRILRITFRWGAILVSVKHQKRTVQSFLFLTQVTLAFRTKQFFNGTWYQNKHILSFTF